MSTVNQVFVLDRHNVLRPVSSGTGISIDENQTTGEVTLSVSGQGNTLASKAGVAIHDSGTEAVSVSYEVPANFIVAGTILKIKYRGHASATISTDTLKVRLRFGTTTLTGTVLLDGGAINVADADHFNGEFTLFGTAAAGATAAIFGMGSFVDPAATTITPADLASTNFATNGALKIEVTLDWSTANANSAVVDWFTVEDATLSSLSRAMTLASKTGIAVGPSSTTEAVSAGYDIPANFIKSGTILKVRYKGHVTASHTTDGVEVNLRIGATTLTGTLLIDGAAVDVANADVFQGEFFLYGTAAPGAAAAVFGQGRYVEPQGTVFKPADLASTNLATNGVLHLEVCLKWNASDAGNSAIVDWFTVEAA